MAFSPQSQSIIDRLLSGEKVHSGATVIGPLNEYGRTLLRVVCDNYDDLQKRTGEDRAQFLRKRYRDAKENTTNEATASEGEGLPAESPLKIASHAQPLDTTELDEPTPGKAYMLNSVECTSFRGIAPAGERLLFMFDGKSNLIYGPNGSGKTSLLGAVIWVLTGHAMSDAHIESDTAPVHNVPKSDGKGTKITNWPVVATLPDGKITKDTIQECSVRIKLVSSDGSSTLHLRRSIADGPEFSNNGKDWKPCDNLTQFGIKPLDLQLSLHAPTTFGRFTVENAPDTKSLLSLMLGYDDLENLGELASNISRNRTSLANREQKVIDAAWDELTTLLSTTALS